MMFLLILSLSLIVAIGVLLLLARGRLARGVACR